MRPGGRPGSETGPRLRFRPGPWVSYAAIAVAGCGSNDAAPQPPDPQAVHAGVEELLAVSAEAWNAGDLDGFLAWYDQSPETTFLGSAGRTHGWEAVRDRYAPRFQPGALRDSLRFEDLETRPLGPGLGLATARYVLIQADSVTSTGVFTLVVRQTPRGWRIIHDHSSETPN